MYVFGELLRGFRERIGLNQQALAYKLGTHRTTISAWERSLYLPATRETVLILADALLLSQEETDQLLFAANYPLEYQTKKADTPLPALAQFEDTQRKEREKQEQLRVLADDKYGWFVNDRLGSFVGREQELSEIRQCINRMLLTGGYVTITGPAGQGKSSIIAKLVKEYGSEKTAHYFIPLNPGPDHQIDLLRNLMAQLILKHGLSNIYVASESRAALRDFFPKVLADLAAKRRYQTQEIIFIDGLDQLEEELSGTRDLSFLPTNPPPGVVFVLGTRPDDTLQPLELLKPRYEYQLQDLSRADFNRILMHRQVQLDKSLADRFYEAMQRNALYLDLLAKELGEIEADKPEEIMKLVGDNPENLFTLSIARLKRHRQQWKKIIRPVLGVLLVAREPLNEQHIRQILGAEADALRDGLLRLGGLVARDGRHYSLFHLKLRDYLHQNELKPDKEYIFATEEVEEWHRKLAQWCEQDGLSAMWQDVKSNPVEQGRRKYARQHYIAHLFRGGKKASGQLWDVLDGGEYGRAKLRNDPSPRFYAQDLDLGRQAAADRGQSLEQGLTVLPNLWRYTLLRSNLISRADKYPEEAFEVLVLLGQEQKAAGLAELLTDPAKRAEVLRRIAEEIVKQVGWNDEARQLLTRASDLTRSLPKHIEMGNDISVDEWEEKFLKKWETLRSLLKQLVLAQEWEWAESVVLSVGDGYDKAIALKELARVLTEAQEWERAVAVVRSIEDSEERGIEMSVEERAEALSTLAGALGSAREWDRLAALAGSFEVDWEKDMVLKALAVTLTKAHRWKQAETAARSIADREEKAEALLALATTLGKAGEWEQAEVVIQSLEDNEQKVQALAALLDTLKEEEEGQIRKRRAIFWAEAEAVAWAIEDSETRVKALTTLLVALERQTTSDEEERERRENLWEAVESFVWSIKDRQKRAKGLEALALALARVRSWEWALALAESLEADAQDNVLCEIAAMMAEAQEWERASDVWFSIQNEWKRNQAHEKVLKAEVAALAEAQQWEEADQSLEFIDSSWQAREEALKDLLKQLVRAQEWERAKQVARFPEGWEKDTEASIMLVTLLAEAQAWEQAEMVALSIEYDNEARAKALSILGKHLIKAQQLQHAKKVWSQVEEAVRTTEDLDGKVWYQSDEVWNLRVELLRPIFEQLVRTGKWEHAIDTAHSIEDQEIKDEMLYATVLALIEMQDWKRAESVTCTLESEFHRKRIWLDLVKRLTEAREWEWAEAIGFYEKDLEVPRALAAALIEAQEWERAEAIAKIIAENTKRAEDVDSVDFFYDSNSKQNEEILCKLASGLAEIHQWERAQAIAHSIQSNTRKAQVLRAIAVSLAKEEEWERAEVLWSQLEQIAQTTSHDFRRAEVWSELAVALFSAQRWEQAEAIVHSIENLGDKFSYMEEALKSVVRSLIRMQEWKRAEALVHSMEAKGRGFYARKELLAGLIEAQQWERAEALAYAMENKVHRAEALRDLAIGLSKKKEWKHAKAVAMSIVSSRGDWWNAKLRERRERSMQLRSKAEALKAIAVDLATEKEWKLAEAVAKSIEDQYREHRREAALEALVSSLSADQHWEQAKVIAFSIESSEWKARALRRLVEALAEAGEKEKALQLVQQWELMEAGGSSFEADEWRARALRRLVEILVETGEQEEALRLIQRQWLRVDTNAFALKLLPLVNPLIPLKPEIGWDFYDSFLWVDDFLRI